MLKKIAALLLVLSIFVVTIWFTRINPGQVHLDLGFGTADPSIPMAFSITFVAGWCFGLLCTLAFIVRLVNERRRLRSALRSRESEISSLRSLPIADAD